MKWSKIILKLRALQHTWRWNFHPRVRQESVAEHSYWVAVYTMALAHIYDLEDLDALTIIQYALLHDAEEAVTGDLPGPVKRNVAWDPLVAAAQVEIFGCAIKAPDQFLRDVVKKADLLASLMFAHEEVMLGNRYFVRIRGELIKSCFDKDDQAMNELLNELGFKESDGVEPWREMSHL